jgi:Lrp/AsnC family transcriptional regulator for asnA, asnC and gidA
MQVVAVTNPLQVGFPRAAMIGITVEADLEADADQDLDHFDDHVSFLHQHHL